jgi:hypothetical protein
MGGSVTFAWIHLPSFCIKNFGFFLSDGLVFYNRYLYGCVHPNYADAGSITQSNKVPIFDFFFEKGDMIVHVPI